MQPKLKLKKALPSDAETLTRISQRAFDSDVDCGATEPGGPPGYNSIPWQKMMINSVDYYKIIHQENIIS